MLDFITVAIKNLFSKPSTRKYPSYKRKDFVGQRGKISIDIDNCIYCGMCSRKCPVGAITVSRNERTWSINRFRCVNCSYCVESCPKKCLVCETTYTPPAYEKSVDIFKGKPLEKKVEPVKIEKEKANA